MEHPAAERPGTPTPGLLRLRRRRDGTPAALVTHRSRAPFWGHPGAEARRRHLWLVASLGSLSGSPGVRPGLRRAVVMGNRR